MSGVRLKFFSSNESMRNNYHASFYNQEIDYWMRELEEDGIEIEILSYDLTVVDPKDSATILILKYREVQKRKLMTEKDEQ